MTATVAGIHLGIDTHANRPAANTAPDGSLYSCSTHGLIYKSNYSGNSWATWLTLPDVAGHLADTSDAHDASAISFAPAGTIAATDVQAAIEEVAAEAGGGGGITRTTQGTTSMGASFQGTRGVYLKKITLASAGFIASIVGGLKGDATNLQGADAAVFSDSGGNPLNVIATAQGGALLSDSSAYATGFKLNATARDIAFPIGAWLVSGDYWLAIRLYGGNDGFMLLAYSSGTGADHSQASSTSWSDSSIVGATTDTTHNFTIYANVLR